MHILRLTYKETLPNLNIIQAYKFGKKFSIWGRNGGFGEFRS